MSTIAEVFAENQAESQQETAVQEKLPGFQAAFSKELQGHKAFEGMKNSNDLAKRHLEVLAKLEKSISIPGEDATDEDRKAFQKAWGVPESPDEYEVPKEYESVDPSGDYRKMVKEAALAAGLSKKQAESLLKKQLEWIDGVMKQGAEAKSKAESELKSQTEAMVGKTMDELKKRWPGEEFEKRKAAALEWFARTASDEEKEQIKALALGFNPDFIEWAADKQLRTKEGSFMGGLKSGPAKPMTLAASAARLNGG